MSEDGSTVREYDIAQASLKRVASFDNGNVEHPNYSADGQTVVFSSESSSERQIWSANDGELKQLTSGGLQKEYPIMP